MKRAQNNMNQQFNQQDTTHNKEEGEINITNTSNTKKPGKKNKLGEYVDFEEIKDDTSNQ